MVIRKYTIPDADMIQSGKTKRALFLIHKAAFLAKDATVDDPFAANWLTSINASEAVDTDEVREDQQQQETQDVLEVMADARKKYIEMKYYIEKGFANKTATMNKFGLDNYGAASGNQESMILFLKNLHKQSEVAANKAILLANGCTQPQIDEIETLHDALSGENTEQDAFIKSSPVDTDARITQYNQTEGFEDLIARLSKVVYYGNVTMLNLFKKPEGAQPDPDINVKGKVTSAAEPNGIKNVEVTIVELGITDNTTFYGNFSFVSIPDGNYTLRYEKAGYTTATKPITIIGGAVVIGSIVLA